MAWVDGESPGIDQGDKRRGRDNRAVRLLEHFAEPRERPTTRIPVVYNA